ncbi:calcium ion-binding protein [Tasmannia lanceolata]|uniref:calcium ion-binding protein n=1 Tax=Tasmannia lanceolata TaxID=3420 RepID=UPI00406287EC
MGNNFGVLPSIQNLSSLSGMSSWHILTDKIYGNYEMDSEENFYEAILDFFSKVNSSMLGMHYDAPTLEEVKSYFHEKLKVETDVKKKKELFHKFLIDKVTLSKTSMLTMLTGVAAPPAATILKRTGENLPQINIIRYIPDYVFVPGTTVLTLFVTKFIEHNAFKKIINTRNGEPKNETDVKVHK